MAPLASWEDINPQAIRKLWPFKSFDYMVRYKPQPKVDPSVSKFSARRETVRSRANKASRSSKQAGSAAPF